MNPAPPFILLVMFLARAVFAQAPLPPLVTNQPPLIFFRATASTTNEESGFSDEISNAGPASLKIVPPPLWTPDHYTLYFGRVAGAESNHVNLGTNTLVHWPLPPAPRVFILIFTNSLITSPDLVHWTTNEQLFFRNAKLSTLNSNALN